MALLFLSVGTSLSLGSADLPLSQVWGILLHQIPGAGMLVSADWPQSAEQIVLKVRFPRVLLAILVGACLSLAGAGFQGIMRNPLADPYTLGVASGSAVGASLMILFGSQYALLGQWSVPLAAFGTGLLSLWMVIRLANNQGKIHIETLILSGVVAQAFLGSIVSLLVSLSDQVVNEILFWLMGSLAFRGLPFTMVLLPALLLGLVILMGYSRTMNVFALGERQAAHLGIEVDQTKIAVLSVSTLLTAVAVSVSGIIGFVGLVVPHLVRLMAGPDYRLLLPLSALYGGVYVLWADTLARTVLSPTEIPLGVVTAFLGTPFFAYLLKKKQRSGKGEAM